VIHELRIYHLVPGTLGRLNERFEKMTIGHFKKHGIRPITFWTVTIGDGGNSKLIYILEWESLAEREQKWDAFQRDETWMKDRAATEQSGPIVARIESMILTPTAYSPVKQFS
jgi:hypothetical protein